MIARTKNRGLVRTATTIAALIATNANALPITPPHAKPYQLAPEAAQKLTSLVEKFSPDSKGTSLPCIEIKDHPDKANCILRLPCALGILLVESDQFRKVGLNFGGDWFLNDPKCNDRLFFSEVEAILTYLFDLSAERAKEVLRHVEGEPYPKKGCNADGVSELPEGSGTLTYARDDEYVGPQKIEGKKLVKIFCWVGRTKS